ncbi:hypothetical protein [Gudgenby Calliphora mononega-like virus]|uniref:Uncharacterized protein n=1 Tax=Gudgenby Calliphora mononega-like virus TaxID=2716744 RepID=A0A6G7PRU2_9MONO|nr:hypothetical protein [Gudgenby Calliphora mononega-like virus]
MAPKIPKGKTLFLTHWFTDIVAAVENHRDINTLSETTISLGSKLDPSDHIKRPSNEKLQKLWSEFMDESYANSEEITICKILLVTYYWEDLDFIHNFLKKEKNDFDNVVEYVLFEWKQSGYSKPFGEILDVLPDDDSPPKKGQKKGKGKNHPEPIIKIKDNKTALINEKIKTLDLTEEKIAPEVDTDSSVISGKETSPELCEPEAYIKDLPSSSKKDILFPFLNDPPPSGIFSIIFDIGYLNCLLQIELSPIQHESISKMTSSEAWYYCDQNIFIPHFDLKRSKFTQKIENIIPPYVEKVADEIEKKVIRIIEERRATSDPNQMILQELKLLKTQLISAGRMVPPIASSAQPFVPAVLPQQPIQEQQPEQASSIFSFKLP